MAKFFEQYNYLPILPFDDKGDTLKKVIRNAISSENINMIRINISENNSRNITGQMIENIKRADIIIADLTRRNPNVLFELGYAYALGKYIIIIIDESSEKIKDLRGLNQNILLTYNTDNYKKFQEQLKKIVSIYMNKKGEKK